MSTGTFTFLWPVMQPLGLRLAGGGVKLVLGEWVLRALLARYPVTA
jgi:hypothetical protein